MTEPNYHIVSLSGGKDSTALLLRMLEERMPVDEILFCDTTMEFPQMYEHLDKLERYIGRPITRLKAPCSFEEYFYSYVPKTSRSTLPGTGTRWSLFVYIARNHGRLLYPGLVVFCLKQES